MTSKGIWLPAVPASQREFPTLDEISGQVIANMLKRVPMKTCKVGQHSRAAIAEQVLTLLEQEASRRKECGDGWEEWT